MNEAIYKSLIKRGNGILTKHKIVGIEAGDLISETLIKYGFENEDSFVKKMFLHAGVLKERLKEPYMVDAMKKSGEMVGKSGLGNKKRWSFKK